MESRAVSNDVIKLPLNSGNPASLKNFSSDDFNNIVCQGLFPADMITTYWARYSWLIEQIKDPNNLQHHFGAGIDCTLNHPAVAAGIWSAIFVLAMANMAREAQTQQAAKKRNSHTYICGKLQPDVPQSDQSDSESEPPSPKSLAACNNYLKRVLERDPALKAKYELVEFVEDSFDKKKTELVFTKCKKEEKKEGSNALETKAVIDENDTMKMKWYNRILHQLDRFRKSRINRKVITPLVDGTFLCAFTYWILWGNTVAFTGNTDAGMGLPMGVGFGIPFAIGGAYFLQKGIRFIRHKGWKSKTPEEEEKEKAEKAAKEDAVCLMRQVVALKKFNDAKELLKKSLPNPREFNLEGALHSDMDKKIGSLRKHLFAKSALSGFTDFVSYYGVVQYIAWVFTDFLTKVGVATVGIPVVNLVAGSVLLGWSLIHSIVKVAGGYYTRQQEALQAAKVPNNLNQQEKTLEEMYQKKLNEIRELKKKKGFLENDPNFPTLLDVTHPQFFGDEMRSGSLAVSNTKKSLVDFLVFINAITTGAFFARLGFVKGTAVALSAACVTLANPLATILIVFGFGVAFAGIKLLEHRLDRQAAEAKEALNKREERIAYLKEQLELADLTEQVLRDPNSKLFEKSAVESVQPPKSNVVSFSPVARLKSALFGSRSGSVAPNNDPQHAVSSTEQKLGEASRRNVSKVV